MIGNIVTIGIHVLLPKITDPLPSIVHGNMSPPLRNLFPTSDRRPLKHYYITFLAYHPPIAIRLTRTFLNLAILSSTLIITLRNYKYNSFPPTNTLSII